MGGKLINLVSRGVSLFVRVVGDGYPMLLMHGGLGVDHSTLLPMARASDGFRLIFYDHRCNGRSKGAALHSLTWENLTQDAEALREVLGIRKWAVLGHSFGGFIAQEYALRFPERITHLILMDTGADCRLVREGVPALLKDRGYTPSQVDAARQLFTGDLPPRKLPMTMINLRKAYTYDQSLWMQLRVLANTLRMRSRADACMYGFGTLLKDWKTLNRFGDIKIPVLLLAGTEDFQFPPEHQKRMKAKLSNVTYVPIERCSHNPLVEAPKKTIETIKRFVQCEMHVTSR
jgi:proline iminopeptidase